MNALYILPLHSFFRFFLFPLLLSACISVQSPCISGISTASFLFLFLFRFLSLSFPAVTIPSTGVVPSGTSCASESDLGTETEAGMGVGTEAGMGMGIGARSAVTATC
jgi:hypothetical protein